MELPIFWLQVAIGRQIDLKSANINAAQLRGSCVNPVFITFLHHIAHTMQSLSDLRKTG
tara:strand:- start:1821 stop:1997 length:177 start_codon:yes stop_codon:yes gene_type:complete